MSDITHKLLLRLFFAILENVYYLVKIPHPVSGNDEYLIEKPTGLFDAVRRALAIHEKRLGRWPDDNVVTVIEDGQQSIYWNCAEHNAKHRQWRVRVGRVREEPSLFRATSLAPYSPGAHR